MSHLSDADEKSRVEFLESLTILDTAPDKNLDRIVSLCRMIFDVPIAGISMVDHDRLWFKSIQGIEISETDREDSFCNATIESQGFFEVTDATLSAEFKSNPAVIGETHLRYYAGYAITVNEFNIGSLCLMDSEPRAAMTQTQLKILQSLSEIVARDIHLQHLLRETIPLVIGAAAGSTSTVTGTGTVFSEGEGTTVTTGTGTTTTTGTGTTTHTGSGTTTHTGSGTTTTTGKDMTTTSTGTSTTTRTGEGSTTSETEGLEVTTTENE